MNTGPVPAYAPGIDVHIQVLKPGERTEPVMRNSTQVEMCIGGVGRVQIGDSDFSVEKFDVWNVPSMEPQVYRNYGQGLFVRLSYRNAPLLEKPEVRSEERRVGKEVV